MRTGEQQANCPLFIRLLSMPACVHLPRPWTSIPIAALSARHRRAPSNPPKGTPSGIIIGRHQVLSPLVTKTFSFISTLFLRLLLAESRSSHVIGKKLAGTSSSQSQSHRPMVLLIAATHEGACAPAREASGAGCEKLVGVP